jgi:hypothetical protein
VGCAASAPMTAACRCEFTKPATVPVRHLQRFWSTLIVGTRTPATRAVSASSATTVSRRLTMAAIEAMNGQYLCNRAITVSYAFKKDTKGEAVGPGPCATQTFGLLIPPSLALHCTAPMESMYSLTSLPGHHVGTLLHIQCKAIVTARWCAACAKTDDHRDRCLLSCMRHAGTATRRAARYAGGAPGGGAAAREDGGAEPTQPAVCGGSKAERPAGWPAAERAGPTYGALPDR